MNLISDNYHATNAHPQVAEMTLMMMVVMSSMVWKNQLPHTHTVSEIHIDP